MVIDTGPSEADPIVVALDRDDRPADAGPVRQRHAGVTALVSEVTAMVLADAASAEVYQRVVEGAASLMRSDNCALVLFEPAIGQFVTQGAFGPAARLHLIGEVQLDPTTMARWSTSETAFAMSEPPARQPLALRRLVGPGAVAPFAGPRPAKGVLTAFRRHGAPPFDAEDVDTLDDIALQVGTVVELGRARTDQHRLALLEDRQRIARDLHDTVIQGLLSIGMQLAKRNTADVELRAQDALLVDQLEDYVRKLRGVVFDARLQVAGVTVIETLAATVAEASRVLGHQPTFMCDPAVDDLPPAVVEHLVPALREALSNVARHAHASTSAVTVTTDGEAVTLTVEDDGIGPGERNPAGTGLSNLRQRADLLNGSAMLTSISPRGSRLVFRARV